MAAHAVKVEGTVLDENKETVIGATVQLKGAAGVGTITDMDGKFVMQVPDVKEGVLIVSYIGYKPNIFLCGDVLFLLWRWNLR